MNKTNNRRCVWGYPISIHPVNTLTRYVVATRISNTYFCHLLDLAESFTGYNTIFQLTFWKKCHVKSCCILSSLSHSVTLRHIVRSQALSTGIVLYAIYYSDLYKILLLYETYYKLIRITCIEYYKYTGIQHYIYIYIYIYIYNQTSWNVYAMILWEGYRLKWRDQKQLVF